MKTNLLLALCLLTFTISQSQTFNSGGLEYTVLTGTNVSVSKITGSCPTGALVIPDTVDYLTITYTVTEVEVDAFRYCADITSVVFSNNIEFIGWNSFAACTSLATAILPINSNYTTVEWRSFHSTALTTIVIPGSVTQINGNAFNSCASLTSISLNDGLIYIDSGAFADSGLTSIVLPNTVTYLKNNALSFMPDLASLTLSNTLQYTLGGAFRDNPSLTCIELPESLTSIGANAFLNCTALTSVKVNWTTPPAIDASIFNNTPLDTLYVPAGTTAAYSSTATWSGFGSIIEWSNTFINGGLQYTITDALNNYVSVAKDPAGCPMGALVIPGTFVNTPLGTCAPIIYAVKEVEVAAFDGCTGITTLEIPDSVTTIGANAFSNLPALTAVTVNWIASTLVTTADNAFGGTTTPATIPLSFPSGTIGDYRTVNVWEDFLYPIKIAIGTDWDTPGDWTPAGVPISWDDAIIPNGILMTVANGTTAFAYDLTVEAGGALTVNTAGSLTLTNAPLKIASDATNSGSFIGKDYTGVISYDRYVTDAWYIISSMVANQNLNGFATLPANNVTTSGTAPIKYALGPYAQTSNNWEYYTSTNIVAAGDFAEAIGYTFKRNILGTVNFTGTHRKVDAGTAIAPPSGTSLGYISLGNPYPSAMDINTDTPASNFIILNDATLEIGNKAVYVFNIEAAAYEGFTDLAPDKYIAPGQGFLIKTVAGGGAISIKEDMQSHQTGILLSRQSSTITRIAIRITDGTLTRKSNVYYDESGSEGMDNNDAIVFANYGFNIYSKLVDGTYADKDFYTQTLPNKDYETMVVSLGVNAPTNTQIAFNFTAENLPVGYMLFLEDRALSTFTRVDTGSGYRTTSGANGVGRFYLHTTTAVLATETTALSKVAIYSVNSRLQLKGISLGKTTVTIYDLLGRVLVKESFKGKSTHVIATNAFVKGSVYIVDLKTTEGKVTQKIIIQ